MAAIISSIPVIVFSILAVVMSFLTKCRPFKSWFVAKLENAFVDHFSCAKQLIVTTDFVLEKSSTHFRNGGKTSLYDLCRALSQLNEYLVRAQGQNGVVFHRTRELTPAFAEQLRRLNYFSKIQSVNASIEGNYKVVESLIEYILERLVESNANALERNIREQIKITCAEFGYALTESNELKRNPDDPIVTSMESNQYRVSEAISHLCRDWSPSFKCERDPVNQFFAERISSLGLQQDEKTLIVVPGAGVGQLSHFLACNFPDSLVDSIEWSPLMYVCGQFALGYGRDVELSPFALRYSGQLDSDRQTRKVGVELSKVRKALNLRSHWGDFCEFVPSEKCYDTIIVCTEFFIDTAENLFEYFETIEHLKLHCKKLHWINAGPLKYGTRPLVQLNAVELRNLRNMRGWQDLQESYETDHNRSLTGYLTDYGSLFQCYYGLLKFHSILVVD
ncbi:YMR209C [Zygosaccharomyces parabailii]|uniref:ZYBA0S08-00606g1_1 n=1 Tax=Zygosaccharomyces bailii (strain CLIB 213 / ATCC 58445 / CBS 680 / BCRC 21525 / NBRC 1098 / NCYC 1416 / NRRL Y-2227) TaxID=1333698 RepID=A0A8J2X2Z8_ZYGB2|nr:YMR209C [Zygosaccharomyces parabailii]CDF90689.1 ZYBA0S08-00606g1_1 [Zygosaccharomyces bailii CLIB 213]SJM85222.1 uncharacterized protein ZBIST_2121 [Zygosaccharomyces bailii]